MKYKRQLYAFLLCALIIFTFTACSIKRAGCLPEKDFDFLNAENIDAHIPDLGLSEEALLSRPDFYKHSVCRLSSETYKKYSESDVLALSNELSGYGQGYGQNGDPRPSGAVGFENKYGKYTAHAIMPDSEKRIYLTFDEGYENGYTAQILDVLKEKNVKAVFFVTYDYVTEQPELIKRMIDEGHVLGNHSMHHRSMPTLDYKSCVSEIMDLHNYIKEKYDYEMDLFRPPMGQYSERTLAITESLGYTTVLWSFAYVDWETDNQPAVSTAFGTVTNSAHNGAVYLLHAVSKTNTAILSDVIDDFRANGYSLDLYK